MKKGLCSLVILLITTFLFGCTGKPFEGAGGDGLKSTDIQQANTLDDLNDAMDAVRKKGWPADQVPTDLPEYTGGQVVNSGDAGDAFFIKINETDQDALSVYLDALRNDGWIVSESNDYSEAVKDVYSIEFTWQGGQQQLQMAIHKEETGIWPTGKIPPDVIMPKNAVLIGDTSVLESVEGQAWYFNYTCDGLDETAAQQYMKLLIENGWEGDASMVYKEFNWNAKKYAADIQIYETVESRTTFTCNFSIVE